MPAAGTAQGSFTKRYVALGDSFTEGVGDIDPSSPNDVRGWADRVAAQLISNDSSWGYANLAIRGKKLQQVLDEQLDAALALKPTLVTLYAGGNDILRPVVNIDWLMERYRAGVEKLAESGARVVLFTGFDSGKAPMFRLTRGRTAIYNEYVRKIAADLELDLVDFWHMRVFQDWRYWDVDRMHLGIAGHITMAKEVLKVLGEQDEIDEPELDEPPVVSLPEKIAAEVTWSKDYLYPWVKRRVTRVSSGDAMNPKYPALTSRIW
ncbi:SGNH/GDSL hydrolase family protein [Nesterenkonia massiliensis]|uniref:SGNH/GDSL hydrolase family protein n=1 Tax=Nesterenkonia massiliensis TaxID=1232429 RepID=A0ABT2HNR9_9MICC|nr:SGNH/GDSL hydrolase family protein [Nesterenkonia massiliensis]MCT1606332.1 SGNH/GDSL hydrolase family protein [Nesterenkonia massiliensis]